MNCKKCAGLLSFDPETELLICTICGHSVVPPLRIVEQDTPPIVKDPQERQAQALERIASALEKLVELKTPVKWPEYDFGPLFKFDPSEVAGKTFVYTCPFCKETVEVDIMNPHNCREPRP